MIFSNSEVAEIPIAPYFACSDEKAGPQVKFDGAGGEDSTGGDIPF